MTRQNPNKPDDFDLWAEECRDIFGELAADALAKNNDTTRPGATPAVKRVLPGVGATLIGLPVLVITLGSAAPIAAVVPVSMWLSGLIGVGWWRAFGSPELPVLMSGAERGLAAVLGLGGALARRGDRWVGQLGTRLRPTPQSSAPAE